MSRLERALRKAEEANRNRRLATFALRDHARETSPSQEGLSYALYQVRSVDESEYENPVDVALREVERVTEELVDLQGKFEILLSRTGRSLGSLREAIISRLQWRELTPFEDLETEHLENLIFIGRRKG